MFIFLDIDECKDKFCENGGICINFFFGSYMCNCVEGFKGERC